MKYRRETTKQVVQEHLHINLFVNVVLLGFTGDSNHAITIDTASLRGLLQDTFPKHTYVGNATFSG